MKEKDLRRSVYARHYPSVSAGYLVLSLNIFPIVNPFLV